MTPCPLEGGLELTDHSFSDPLPCLLYTSGADDMGSIMIEENVVSAAGAPFRFTANGIQQAIRDAGYTPQLRDQQYSCLLYTSRCV